MIYAEQLVELKGDELIGCAVLTFRMGEYPGGIGIVSEIRPDPNAPDIAFIVENEDWVNHDGTHSIGVFTYEKVIELSK